MSGEAYFSFLCEPRGARYRMVLQAGLQRCSQFLVVERPDFGIPLAAEGQAVLGRLKAYLIKEDDCSEWPGTRLLYDRVARVRLYHLNPDSAAVLEREVDRLYAWQQPTRPEDLCLLRPDGRAWLVTSSHEREGYVAATPEERSQLRSEPELDRILGKIGEPL